MQWPAVSKGRCQLRHDMLMDALRSTNPQRCAQTIPSGFDTIRHVRHLSETVAQEGFGHC